MIFCNVATRSDFSEHLRTPCSHRAATVVKLYPRRNRHFPLEVGIVVLMMKRIIVHKVGCFFLINGFQRVRQDNVLTLCIMIDILQRYNGPSAFIIPGNHDWFDGLSTFTKFICHRDFLGGAFRPSIYNTKDC